MKFVDDDDDDDDDDCPPFSGPVSVVLHFEVPHFHVVTFGPSVSLLV